MTLARSFSKDDPPGLCTLARHQAGLDNWMGKSGSEDQTPKPGGSGIGSRQLDTSWICRLKLSWTEAWGGARHVATCLFAPPLLGGPSQ